MSFFGDDAFEDDQQDAENEAEEDDEGDKKASPQRDMIIFAVDGSEAMYAPTENGGQSPIQRAMDAISFFYKDHVIIAEQDFLSVVLYNTNPKNVVEDFLRTDTVMTLIPPNRPAAKEVLLLKQLSEDITALKDLTDGPANSSIDNVLQSLHTMQMVEGRQLDVANKLIYIFTNNDSPRCEKRRTKALLETWKGSFVLTGFFMHRPDRPFDGNKFWNALINDLRGEDSFAGSMEIQQSWEDLKNRVRRKLHKKRVLMKLALEIAPNVEIGVNLYGLITDAKTPAHSWVTAGEEAKDVKTEMQYLGSVGEELADFQLSQMMEFGSELVFFEKEEVKKLKDFGPPGIKLIGFKPRSSLKIHHNIRPSSFIYPNNETVEGSITAFAALHAKMLELDKIAICRIISRFSKYPRLVALLPQQVKEDEETGCQVHPPGFHIIYLPFADDIRKLNVEDGPKATTDQVDKAKKVIKAFTLAEFDCRNFDNPALQRHYDVLQAEALDEGIREDNSFDRVHPAESLKAAQKIGPLVEDWAKDVWGDDYETAGEPSAKRAKPADPAKAAAKAEKDAEAAEKAAAINWKSLAADGSIKSLTMDQLKSYCRTNGLKLSGKKEELVARVQAHIDGK
eukprot:tig00000402_g197.t1